MKVLYRSQQVQVIHTQIQKSLGDVKVVCERSDGSVVVCSLWDLTDDRGIKVAFDSRNQELCPAEGPDWFLMELGEMAEG